MPRTLEKQVYEYINQTGNQACIQVAVGLGLPYPTVKAAVDALVNEGQLQRYIPDSLRHLHLEEENIFFYGAPPAADRH